jgi:purine catabolism regulator
VDSASSLAATGSVWRLAPQCTSLAELGELFGRVLDSSVELVPADARKDPPLRGVGILHEPVVVNGRPLAWLTVLPRAGRRPDPAQVEECALVAAIFLAQESRLSAAFRELRDQHLQALLLAGRPLTAELAQSYAERLELCPDATYWLVVALDVQPAPAGARSLQAEIRRVLADSGRPDAIASRGAQHAFLLEADCPVAELTGKILGPRTALCVSSQVLGIRELPRAFVELEQLAPLMRPGHLYSSDDLLVPRVLLGDETAHLNFVDHLLGPLRAVRNGDLLIASLLAYAKAGFQRDRTAAALCVHPNTLRYRLERIQALTGMELRDSEARFRIQLVERIAALRKL